MKHYSEAAVERMMKVQEVILRAIAGKLQWWQAAEIVGDDAALAVALPAAWLRWAL